jgi:hypothetical protein
VYARAIVVGGVVIAGAVGLATAAGPSPSARERIAIVVDGDVTGTLAPGNLEALLRLERKIDRLPGVTGVRGPGTFVEGAVARTTRLIRRKLRGVSDRRQAYRDLLVRIGSVGPPALGNRMFVATLVYGAGTSPKPGLRSIFPSSRRALIVVGAGPGVTPALERRVRRLARGTRLDGLRLSVGDFGEASR